MCNLYSLNKDQDAIRRAFGIDRYVPGNLPPLPAILPDQMAPVVRLADGVRALEARAPLYPDREVRLRQDCRVVAKREVSE